jgi:hypothetical protein
MWAQERGCKMTEKTHNEEFHNLYFSSSIIRVIMPATIRWAGCVSCTREMRNAYKLLIDKPEGKNHFRFLGVDEMILNAS